MDVDTADTEMDDEEVDQLDSDLNEDVDDARSASSDDAHNKEEGQRVPGQTLLPEIRVENIIHADGMCILQSLHPSLCRIQGAIGTGGHMSREAMFMLSIATASAVFHSKTFILPQSAGRVHKTSRRSRISSGERRKTCHGQLPGFGSVQLSNVRILH